MKNRILHINPAFEHLRSFIESVPKRFEEEGETIYTGRNLIKVFESEGLRINVKRYHTPFFINSLIYSYFRPSKGWRAFTYPQRLLQAGVSTPEPIAYIEERRCGLIGLSYFISIQKPHARNFYEFGTNNVTDCVDIIEAFARFTARLHESGIYHRDYSPGNVLFDKINGEWDFCLVDINRMNFGTVSLEKGCANFARLWGQTPFFLILAQTYAEARGYDPELCRRLILKYRQSFWKHYRLKHAVRFPIDI